MSDASSTTAPAPRNTGLSDDTSHKMSPLMRVLIIVAVAVALLALIIMFVFASHQSALHDQANNQTTSQSADKNSSTTSTSTLGPIEVNKSSLYNRENDALGRSGSGPKSVIYGTTPGVLPPDSTTNPSR